LQVLHLPEGESSKLPGVGCGHESVDRCSSPRRVLFFKNSCSSDDMLAHSGGMYPANHAHTPNSPRDSHLTWLNTGFPTCMCGSPPRMTSEYPFQSVSQARHWNSVKERWIQVSRRAKSEMAGTGSNLSLFTSRSALTDSFEYDLVLDVTGCASLTQDGHALRMGAGDWKCT
jgi:hypothetical protein